MKDQAAAKRAACNVRRFVGGRCTNVGHKASAQSQVGIAYFLAIRLSARVIDFACLLGRGMADPVDATR